MAGNMLLTSDQIKKAVVQKQRPAYTELLDFYGQIFTAQEGSKSLIKIDPVKIPEHIGHSPLMRVCADENPDILFSTEHIINNLW